MGWGSLVNGAGAIAPFWRLQALDGARMANYKPLDEITLSLRETGLRMERAMYRATGGVNTHKGLIFAMSLILGACGVLSVRARCGGGAPGEPDALDVAGRMIAPSVSSDLGGVEGKAARGEPLTHGERIYLEHGVGGRRAEASAGLPTVRAALAESERALAAGAKPRDARIAALLGLMSSADDTNVIHRCGMDFWNGEYKSAVQIAARDFDPASPGNYKPVTSLGRFLEARGASPGGAADLLACTLFIHRSKIAVNKEPRATARPARPAHSERAKKP
jgi:triphosphoribosyl-dephospho-CoA synthetase